MDGLVKNNFPWRLMFQCMVSHMMGNVKTVNILRKLTLYYNTFLCKIEDPQRISRFDQII